MSKRYSNVLKRMILPLGDVVMGTNLKAYYQLIIKMQTWSKDEIFNWQNTRLHDLISHAYSNTDYYHNIFNKNGINPHDIKTIEDLEIIPDLTKKDIINNFEKLIPKNIQRIRHIVSSTGGSTGDPMKFLLDKDSWSFSNANNIINWERTSYNYGDKFIALGSTSINVDGKLSLKHRLYYKLKNKIALSGINMSDEVCKEYLTFIINHKIKYVYGYASAIYLLARYAKANNIYPSIDACFPTSEILTPVYRETIERAFSCKIVNCYGAHDGGITAFEHQKDFFEVGYNSIDRKSTRLNSSHIPLSRMPSSA